MASLEAIGKLNQVKTFQKPLIIEKINETELTSERLAKTAEATYLVAEKNGKKDLAEQLKRQVINYKSKVLLRDFNENLEIILESPDFINISQRIFSWYIQRDTKKAAKILAKTIARKLRKKRQKNN